jgi:thiol-disulfide isomerase/thioredoxin
MRRPVAIAAMAVVAAIALAAGIYVRQESRIAATDGVLVLTRTPFKNYSGQAETLERWKGKVVVINFWASWCPPCREEIPGLTRVQTRFGANGVQIVGIAVDSVDKARQAATELGVNYPILVAGLETIDLTRRLGNQAGALPFTLVLDRNGTLVASHLGILSEDQLARLVAPLLG